MEITKPPRETNFPQAAEPMAWKDRKIPIPGTQKVNPGRN